MSDERFSPEQQALAEEARKARKRSADPPALPCRKYIDNPVTPEEIERFAEELVKP